VLGLGQQVRSQPEQPLGQHGEPAAGEAVAGRDLARVLVAEVGTDLDQVRTALDRRQLVVGRLS
jgi:hypothetical protein